MSTEPTGEEVEMLVCGSPDWSDAFQTLCDGGIDILRAGYGRFCRELWRRGHAANEADVGDALSALARELCPESRAARDLDFADFASDLWQKAIRFLAERCDASRAEGVDLTEEGMEGLWGDREAYRAELRRRVRRVLEDERLRKTGVLQNTGQVFEEARGFFGGDAA